MPETPKYLDESLSFAERARDLVSRMTLEEKASQMVYTSPAIERLGVPAYNWCTTRACARATATSTRG